MKKNIALLLLCSLVLMVFATGCAPQAESITFEAAGEMQPGDSVTLSAQVLPENARDLTIQWASSDESVLAIDAEGVLTAVGVGDAIITATTVNGLSAQAAIRVFIPLTGLSSTKDLSLEVGESQQVDAVPVPEDATDVIVSYTSSDETVATVDEAGVVTAVSQGITMVKAEAEGFEATTTVIVLQPPTGLSLDYEEAQLYTGHSFTITAVVEPDTADTKTEIEWSSSDEAVATVDASGEVLAVKPGTAIITATTENGITAECEVTVTAPPQSGGNSGSGGSGGSGSSGDSGGSGGGGGGSGTTPGGDTGGGNGGDTATPSISLSEAIQAGTAHATGLGFSVSNSPGGSSYEAPYTTYTGATQQSANSYVIGAVDHAYNMCTKGGYEAFYPGTSLWIYESGGMIFVAW